MVDWITISSNSGNSGTTVITVTAATYDELITRTTSLVVNTVNTSLSESVSISQAPREVEIVTVSPSTISAPKEGGTYTFNIISNGAWTISYPDEWITISQSAGTGSATITVDIPQNLVLSGKTGNIEVSTRDNTAIVQVTQERNTGYINVDPSVLEYVYSGGSKSVLVSSNTDWTISNVPNWVSGSTLSGNGNSTVIFTVIGTAISDRTSVIKFSVLDEDAYLTIRQSSTIPYLYFENSAITFSNTGGTQINRVNSNVQWEMEVIEELTFEIISGGTITWNRVSNLQKTIEYSINGGEWGTMTTDYNTPSITVETGDIVKFRGNNSAYGYMPNSSISNGCYFNGTAIFKVKGNIMSLINSTDYSTITTLNDAAFPQLFYNCTGLTDASRLLLPATTLSKGCYTLMFAGCVNLLKAPKLPATTLANMCYSNMFAGCRSLTEAPELPATTLPSMCYDNMFYDCTNLNYIKCLATDKSAFNCTNYWVYGVANSGTFVKNINMNSWNRGDSDIPNNWTVKLFNN